MPLPTRIGLGFISARRHDTFAGIKVEELLEAHESLRQAVRPGTHDRLDDLDPSAGGKSGSTYRERTDQLYWLHQHSHAWNYQGRN